MARLHDILKRGVPCKVRKMYGGQLHETTWRWNGRSMYDDTGKECLLSAEWILSDKWHIETEPTVDDVLKERGYRDAGLGTFSCVIKVNQNFPSVTALKIKSPAEATRVCDFLDSLKEPK